MIDTPEKARAYGRLQTAIHRLYEAVANMDEGAIGDIARRVEVVADSVEPRGPHEYAVGDDVEVARFDASFEHIVEWHRGKVEDVAHHGAGRIQIRVEGDGFWSGLWYREIPGDEARIRKVSR